MIKLNIEPKQIDKFENKGVPYCNYDVIYTIASYLDIDINLMFLKSWRFDFRIIENKIDVNIDIFKNEKILLKKYCGLDLIPQDIQSSEKILPIIEKELKIGYPVIVEFDCYWCPWDDAYQNKDDTHNNHVCIINGIDYENKNLYFTDPYFSKRDECLTFEQFSYGFRYCETIKIHNKNSFDKYSVLSSELLAIREYLKNRIKLFADIVEQNKYNSQLLEEARSAIMSFGFDSMKTLSLIKFMSEYPEYEEAYNQLKKIYIEAKTIHYMIWKGYITKNRNDVISICVKRLRNLALENETLIQYLLNVCERNSIDKMPIVIFNNMSILDIKKHFNSKAVGAFPENIQKADLTGDGFYIVNNKELEEDYISVRDIIFKLPDFLKDNEDNISCNGQIISISCETEFEKICLLGCAEFGDHIDYIIINYDNDISEKIQIRFSDFIKWNKNTEDKLDEMVAWIGDSANKEDIIRGNCHVYAGIYTLKVKGRVKNIVLPELPNIHIFAVTFKI